jgi:hypothetical protein
VLADHIRPVEDLHDCFVLLPPWVWNSLDSELLRSGDVSVVQQIPQSTGGDQSFIFDSLYLISLMIHLLLLRVVQRSVVLIIFYFSLLVFFFLLVIVIVVVVIVLIVMVVTVAIILRQLWSFYHCFLSVFSCRYHDHDLERILLLTNVLMRVMLWLLLG